MDSTLRVAAIAAVVELDRRLAEVCKRHAALVLT